VGEEMGHGLKRKSQKQQTKEEKPVFVQQATLTSSEDNDEELPASLSELKKQEEQLLDEEKKLLNSLDDLRVQRDRVAEERNRLIANAEKRFLSSQGQNLKGPNHRLFVIETSGSKFTDGMVFTVLAEDHVWAEYMVRQWLDSNDRELDKIDKGHEIMSHDVRAIISLGAKPLDG
jgi:chromosome segregation ATPase